MKKLLKSGLLIGLILSLFLSSVPAFAADQQDEQNLGTERILVKFQPGTPEKVKNEIHQKRGSRVEGIIPGIDVQIIRTRPGARVEDIKKEYEKENKVIFAEQDFVAEAIMEPDDPYYSSQWGMTKIQAPQAWDITTGEPDVKLAILDTGVDQDHEDLASKIIANRNFTTSGTIDDRYGHGTHVAGIAAAASNNGIGVAGVGYDSTVMNVKVLGDTGSGYYSWIASGIVWAADNGADVISMSLGGGSASSTLRSAVDYAWGKGVVLVAAAGNSGNSNPVYPAYYENVIAVAATNQNDAKASFSSYGNWVDVAAPGVNILATLPNHSNAIGLNYGSLNGTSMATPHVAGLAGLVWATGYGTNNQSVRNRIESTADPVAGTGTYWQHGRINACNAVAPAGPPLPDTTGPVTSDVTARPNPTAGATLVTLTATVSDITTGGSDITAAEYFIDTVGDHGSGTAMVASDGVFNSPAEAVTSPVDVSGLTPGTYTLYVHGKDDKGNWGSTSSTQLAVTEAPAGNINDMYVWSIDFQTVGSGKWQRLYINTTVKRDSNANGLAEATDGPAQGVTVNITLINQTTTQTWHGSGAKTNSSGVASYSLLRPPTGTYISTVSGLIHSTYTWNKALDQENPSDPYIMITGSSRTTGDILHLNIR